MRTEYKSGAFKSTYNGNVLFYPIVKFQFYGCSDNFWLNNPQPTRVKALQVADIYIKNIDK